MHQRHCVLLAWGLSCLLTIISGGAAAEESAALLCLPLQEDCWLWGSAVCELCSSQAQQLYWWGEPTVGIQKEITLLFLLFIQEVLLGQISFWCCICWQIRTVFRSFPMWFPLILPSPTSQMIRLPV